MRKTILQATFLLLTLGLPCLVGLARTDVLAEAAQYWVDRGAFPARGL